MVNQFEKFIDHLTDKGILKEHFGDKKKLVQIYEGIDDSDIQLQEGNESENEPELRIVFALADFLKIRSNDSENGLFDLA